MSEQPRRTTASLLMTERPARSERQSSSSAPRICPACGMPARGPFCSTCYSPRIVEKHGDTLKAWLPVELETSPNGAIAASGPDPTTDGTAPVVDVGAAGDPAPRTADELAAAQTVVGETLMESHPDAEIPEIVGDADPTDAADASEQTHRLPTIDELPVMPTLDIGDVAKPNWRERRKADKTGVEPEELAYQRVLLAKMGISSTSALDAPARAALRLRSSTLAGVRLSPEESQRVIFDAFVEVATEKHRATDKDDEELEQGFGWFVIAGVLHCVLLAAIWSLIMMSQPPEEEEKAAGIYVSALAEMAESLAPPSVERLPSELRIQDPTPTEEVPEVEIPDEMRMDPNQPMPTARPFDGVPAPPSQQLPRNIDLKLPGFGNRGLNGSSDGAPNVGGGVLGTRRGSGKRIALRKNGGSAGTENAVEAGLEWLRRTQLRDGRWEPAEQAQRSENGLAPGYTSLALLCFLGAGHVPWQNSGTRFQPTVDKAIAYLLEKQNLDGRISGSHMGMTYNHGVATLALAEAYAMTGDQRLRRPLENALLWMYDAQMPSGGWDYTNINTANRTDTSITGWMVMAMKSALIAGVDVRKDVWDRAHAAILDLTLPTGEVYYCRNGAIYPKRRGVGMIGVGLLCRLYWGEGADEASRETLEHPESAPAALARSVQWLRDNPPSVDKLKAKTSRWAGMEPNERIQLASDDEYFHTVYYWYYGTLSLFNYTGGQGPLWGTWNLHLQQAILPTQNLDDGSEHHGSWAAIHPFWGRYAGRLYATCLNILNMEIYYRYLPLYGADGKATLPGQLVESDPASRRGRRGNRSFQPGRTPPPPTDDDRDELTEPAAIRILQDPTAPDRDRTEAIALLQESNSESGRKALGSALVSPAVSEFARWKVAKALGEMKAKDQFVAFRNAYRLQFNKDLRPTILEYAGMTGHADAFNWLLGVMKSEGQAEPQLANGAAKGLSHLTGKNYGPSPQAWESYRFNRADE